MSTEFMSATTDEVAFVRWGRTAPTGERTSFEFGTMTNFEGCCAAADNGETFICTQSALEGDPAEWTRETFEAMAASGRATFGDFPIVVAVGSGEMWRFTVES